MTLQSFYNIVRQPSKVLAGVKGLGATKVNSLLDAFNKPFMIGGLKKADGTARPATDLTAAKEMSASVQTAKAAGHDSVSTAEQAVEDPASTGERNGSPDWPSDDEGNGGDDDDGEEAPRPIGRGREKVPSRSPPPTGNGEVWEDPLDDGVSDQDPDDGPPTKRAREG